MQTNWFIYFLIGAFLWSMVVGIILSRNFSKDASNTSLTESKSGSVVQSQQKKKIEVPKDETGTGFEDSIITRPGFHILAEFDKVQTLDDYESFIKEFWGKKPWIYIMAAKKRDKKIWDKFWSFDYGANKELQSIFPNQAEFEKYSDDLFEKIQTDSVEYDSRNDLTLIFSSTKLPLDSAKKFAEKTVDAEYFRNLLYVYRSTPENNLCDEIDKDKSSSLHNLCVELSK